MRALYNYDPVEDSLLPCSDIGLEFKQGDILQVRPFSAFKKFDPELRAIFLDLEPKRPQLVAGEESGQQRPRWSDPIPRT
jgi:hypothetical protein